MSVVMLSGPVGAGKTTVARELVAISPAPLYYIEGDTFWSHFVKPDDKDKDRLKAVYNLHVLLARAYQERDSLPEAVTELEAAKAVAPADGPESVLILWNLGSTYATMTPPKSAEAISMLKGFSSRACKGAKAASYKGQCEATQALVTKLGGTLQ